MSPHSKVRERRDPEARRDPRASLQNVNFAGSIHADPGMVREIEIEE
jgi:hypothetical protein